MTDWENLFKSEDFNDTRFHRFDDNITRMRIADTANTILRKHLSEAPVVSALTVNKLNPGTMWFNRDIDHADYKARLVMIEEIK